MLPRDALADGHRLRFARFAEEVRDTSPLYEHLSRALASDPAARELMDEAPPAQRRPNLLFAAVHDLLLAGDDHALARWYPTVVAARSGDDTARDTSDGAPTRASEDLDGAEAACRDLLRSRRELLGATIRTRHTQTNEVGRCAALWPGLQRAAAPIRRGRPLTLIELGASAGLLLHLDRYHYPPAAPAADPSTPRCRIDAEVVGDVPTMPPPPPVARRVGIDLHPLDVAEADDVRWLIACIWPEGVARAQRLAAAVEVARHHGDVEVVRGDLIHELDEMLGSVDDDTLPCILHSATLAYLDADERATLAERIGSVGRRRDLVWLSLEGPFLEPFRTLAGRAPEPPDGPSGPHATDDAFLLGATVWSDGEPDERLLGRAHPHGRWVHHLDVRPATPPPAHGRPSGLQR